MRPELARAYRLNPILDLHWRIIDSGCVAFEAVSGETVAVDVLEAAALACLEDGPRYIDQLVDDLASDIGTPAVHELRERVDSIVEEFLARGWLVRIECGE